MMSASATRLMEGIMPHREHGLLVLCGSDPAAVGGTPLLRPGLARLPSGQLQRAGQLQGISGFWMGRRDSPGLSLRMVENLAVNRRCSSCLYIWPFGGTAEGP
jgi:hypothetical protein